MPDSFSGRAVGPFANRFAARIRRGEIGSVAELKAEFKALAKLLHPDLAAPGTTDGEDFAVLRADYEAALRDFDLLRFDLPRSRKASGGSGNPYVPPRAVHDRRELYAALAALRGRGFPKRPRHEKEKARYGYSRAVALSRLEAWRPDCPGLFLAFEARLLGARRLGAPFSVEFAQRMNAKALGLLDAILDYHASGVEESRQGLEFEFAQLASMRSEGEAPRGGTEPLGPDEGSRAILGFLTVLVGDLAAGPALLGRPKGAARE